MSVARKARISSWADICLSDAADGDRDMRANLEASSFQWNALFATFDRGLEFASWRELEHSMETTAWSCDPQVPWQKGTVEATNKRVRRYLLPETIVLDVSSQEIRSLCDRLNDTPRKCLGFFERQGRCSADIYWLWKGNAFSFRSRVAFKLDLTVPCGVFRAFNHGRFCAGNT